MISNSGDDRETIVVVGNGMVGHTLCQKLVSLEGSLRYRLIVIGEETRPAYDRVNLSKFLSQTTAKELELKPVTWYEENGIELRLGQRVDQVDRNRKVVSVGAEEVGYDKLILATGSTPFVPPIPGNELPGVFVYRTIEDLEAIRDYSRNVESGAVIGGGLLGLEAARALLDLELKTHVVEVAPGLMPMQLDAAGGKLLQSKIESLGIEVHLPRRTSSIEHTGENHVMQFDSGESLSVGMIVVSAGIRACDQLARDSDLEVGKRGGIVVNDRLQTSDPDIFAIGECASHRGTVYGLVAPGYQMADVLAGILMDGKAAFEGGDRSAKLKLLGVDVATLGSPIGEIPNVTTIESSTEDGYRKLVLSNRRVVGAISVGTWEERDRVQQAIAARQRIWPWNRSSFRNSGMLWRSTKTDSVASWPDDATVCSCLQISRGTLTAACRTGCATAEALAAETGASTVCGSCRPLLCELVEAPEDASPKPKPGLLIATIAALIVASFWLTVGKLPFSESVIGFWHQLDFIWRDNFWKQVTGYTLLGMSTTGLLLPLRKRIKRFTFGTYGLWRTIHAVVGTLTLLGLIVHTGMSLGVNLNFMLSVVFLGINFTGIAVGVFASLESRTRGEYARNVRRWRPRIVKLHFWMLWPLPALLAIHIFCVYYY